MKPATKQIVLNTGKIDTLLHVSGTRGLLRDAAGGSVSNTKLAATVPDFEAVSQDTKANELRYSNSYRIENYLASPESLSSGWTNTNLTIANDGTTVTYLDWDGISKTFSVSKATLTGGTVQHYCYTTNTKTNVWASVYVDLTNITNKTAVLILNGAAFNKIQATFSAARTLALSSPDPADLVYTSQILGDYQAIIYIKSVSGQSRTNLQVYLGAWGNYNGDGQYAYIGRAQCTKYGTLSWAPPPYLNTTVNYGFNATGVKYLTAYPRLHGVHLWGDSLTTSSYSTFAALQPFWTQYNGGVGGETSTQIKTRMVADTNQATRIEWIWAGRNNYTDPTTVKSDIAAMVAAIPHNNYVILSILNGAYGGDGLYEATGGTGYTQITGLNNDLAALYPNNYVDVRAAMVAAYNPNDAQDVLDHSVDLVPTSLRSDAIHPNAAGATVICDTVIAFMRAKGMLSYYPISGDIGLYSNSDAIKIPYSANVNFRHDKGIVLLKVKMKQANSATNKALFAANTGATDFIYDNGAGGIALGDGTNTATASVGGWTTDDILLIGACYDDKAGKMSIHVSKNGGAWIDSSDTTYDGAFPAGSNLVWCSSNTDTIEILSTKVFRSTKGFYKMQNWIKNRAASEAV